MPGTARQYQNARAVPLLDKVLWLRPTTPARRIWNGNGTAV